MEKETRRISLPGVTGAVLCMAFIPIILINLVLIASSYINPGELPGVLGIKPAVVMSGSMEPVIETGDMIFIRSTDPGTLKEGDVICYLLSGKAITHRIVGVTTGEDGQPRYITRGDANNAEDRMPVTSEQVQGIWNGGRIPGLGHKIMAIQTPMGMVLTIICPLLLYIIIDIWLRRRADRQQMMQAVMEKARLEAEIKAMKQQLESGSGTPGDEGKTSRS